MGGLFVDITALVQAVDTLRVEDALNLQLSAPQWQRLGQCLERRELATGDLLIRRGDRERQAWLVESGHLQVFVTSGAPGTHRIGRLRAGAIVGEPALFIDAARMASVEAMSPAVVWSLTADRLERLAQDEPKLALAVVQAAASVMAVRMRMNLERGIPVT